MIRWALSRIAYWRFQARSHRAEARAVATREIGRIRASRTATIHAALASLQQGH